MTISRTLDLGCGAKPRNPFQATQAYGIDIRDVGLEHVRQADLAVEPIPFPDDNFEFVTAFDFVEHIPRVLYNPERRNPFIELMNEVYRVLKPNGTFYSVTPAFPHAAAFMDPTHVNIIAEGTFPMYFGDSQPDAPWGSIYGFKGAFHTISESWDGIHLVTSLQKIAVADSPAHKNGYARKT